MSSIDSLMKGIAPGEIKLALPYRAGWFQPYFRDTHTNWHGLNERDRSEILPGHLVCVLYTEPKPTKVVFEWIYANSLNIWFIEDRLMTDVEAKDSFGETPYRKTGRSFEVECE